jgi:ketosteroid isomerase-like protein
MKPARKTKRDGTRDAAAYADAVRIAERYVGAYNARDLDAMLALMDENVVSYPTALFGPRPHFGHAGVRAWWEAMISSADSFDVVVSEVRPIESDRVALLGEVWSRGRRLSPWTVLVRIRNGLIIESHSYLSDTDRLEKLRLLEAPLST